jgi:hypothetical protein
LFASVAPEVKKSRSAGAPSRAAISARGSSTSRSRGAGRSCCDDGLPVLVLETASASPPRRAIERRRGA